MAFQAQLDTVDKEVPLARVLMEKISDWYTQTTGPHDAAKAMVKMYKKTTAPHHKLLLFSNLAKPSILSKGPPLT